VVVKRVFAISTLIEHNVRDIEGAGLLSKPAPPSPMSESKGIEAAALLKRLDRQLDAIKAQIAAVLANQGTSPNVLDVTQNKEEIRAAFEAIVAETESFKDTEYDPTRKAVFEAILYKFNEVGGDIEYRAEAILEREQEQAQE